MEYPTDNDLLRQYALGGSQEAFEALVRRHIGLVYSVAMRKVQNHECAEEIVQAVFIILAKKAAGLFKHTQLEGWLYETARLASIRYLRDEIRRQRHQKEALSMADDFPNFEIWKSMEPLLDEAMGSLREGDRNAIILHYFENLSYAEAAIKLDINEAAIQRRCSRAVEKLRGYFSKHGIKVGGSILVMCLSANAIHAAPAGITSSIASVAAINGTASAHVAQTLVKDVMETMTLMKIKTTILVVISALAVTGTAVIADNEIDSIRMNEIMNTQEWDLYKLPKVYMLCESTITPEKVYASENGKLTLRDEYKQMPVHLGEAQYIQSLTNSSFIGRSIPAARLVPTVLQISHIRMVFETKLPTLYFDFIANKSSLNEETLIKDLQKRLGVVIKKEKREMNVLQLRMAKDNAPGLKPASQAEHPDDTRMSRKQYKRYDCSMATLAEAIEEWIQVPVVDKTGLTNKFDIDFKLSSKDADAIKADVLDQLGLELVESTEAIDVGVVSKAR